MWTDDGKWVLATTTTKRNVEKLHRNAEIPQTTLAPQAKFNCNSCTSWSQNDFTAAACYYFRAEIYLLIAPWPRFPSCQWPIYDAAQLGSTKCARELQAPHAGLSIKLVNQLNNNITANSSSSTTAISLSLSITSLFNWHSFCTKFSKMLITRCQWSWKTWPDQLRWFRTNTNGND